jgi:hypothetical protein
MTPEREYQLRRLGRLDGDEAAEVWREHDEWKAEAMRLDDECEVAKAEARDAKASAGRARYDLTLARAEKAELALRNVLALANRDVRKVAPQLAEHLVRFCREAGVEPSILRGLGPGEE